MPYARLAPDDPGSSFSNMTPPLVSRRKGANLPPVFVKTIWPAILPSTLTAVAMQLGGFVAPVPTAKTTGLLTGLPRKAHCSSVLVDIPHNLPLIVDSVANAVASSKCAEVRQRELQTTVALSQEGNDREN